MGMSTKATFSSHSIRSDGLHIFSVTEDGIEIDTLISREDAILFDWINEEDGIDEEEEYIGTEYRRHEKKRRELEKLAEWSNMVKGA